MYYGILKLLFDTQQTTKADAKLQSSLIESVRSRFKVCAKSCDEYKKSSTLGIAVATLGRSRQDVNQQLDAISEYCEQAGLGRIESEQAIIELVDEHEP